MPQTPSRDLDLALLRTLHALLSERSVTGAAHRLGVSQPAVSRALRRLRTHFDDPLLLRKPGGVVPTSRAEELLPQLSRWLSDGEALFRPTVATPAQLNRDFRIASTDYGVLSVIGPALDRIGRAAPGVGITVSPLGSDTAAKLRNGELDLILTGFEPDPSLFHAKRLFSDRYTCLVRAGHPLLAQNPVTHAAFIAWPQIVFMVMDKEAPDSGLDLAGSARRVVLRTQNAGIIPTMAAQSDAIALLPRRAVQACASGAQMVDITPPFPIEDFGYWLVWHERNHRDPAILWLIAQLTPDQPGGAPGEDGFSARSGSGLSVEGDMP